LVICNKYGGCALVSMWWYSTNRIKRNAFDIRLVNFIDRCLATHIITEMRNIEER